MSLNKEEADVCNRIKHLFELSNMSQVDFSKSIGIAQASLSNVLNEKTVPGSGFIMAILRQFQNVNSRWLFLGEEPIFATPDQQLTALPRQRMQNNIIHRSSNSGIATENSSQDSGNKNTDLEVYDKLKRCEEENKRLNEIVHSKNEEIISLNREIITHLKK